MPLAIPLTVDGLRGRQRQRVPCTGGGTASEAIGKAGYTKAKGRLEEKPGRQVLNRRTLILPRGNTRSGRSAVIFIFS